MTDMQRIERIEQASKVTREFYAGYRGERHIVSLQPHLTVKQIRTFLNHVDFCCRLVRRLTKEKP